MFSPLVAKYISMMNELEQMINIRLSGNFTPNYDPRLDISQLMLNKDLFTPRELVEITIIQKLVNPRNELTDKWYSVVKGGVVQPSGYNDAYICRVISNACLECGSEIVNELLKRYASM